MPRTALLLLLALAACAPRFSPPYRDYEARAVDGALAVELREAAEAAGWQVVPSRDSSIVTTRRGASPRA